MTAEPMVWVFYWPFGGRWELAPPASTSENATRRLRSHLHLPGPDADKKRRLRYRLVTRTEAGRLTGGVL